MEHIKKTWSQQLFDVFNFIFLSVFGFITFYPFWYVLIASFNNGRDFVKGGVYFWPRMFTLENYTKAFENTQITSAFSITIISTLASVVLGILVAALLAYAMHIRTIPGRTLIFMYFYIPTIIGGGMIPFYILLRDLGLTKNILIYILPGIFGFFNFVLLRLYFDSNLPSDLREAVAIDGAGHITTLFKIYLPLSMPMVATLALFIGVGKWNDWFTGAYYVSNSKIHPAATLLRKILSEASAQQATKEGQENAQVLAQMQNITPQSLQMAFVMILTMPIIVVYPFLQKYFVKGIMVGSIKG